MRWPCPVRSRSRSAARIAIGPCNPASASATANAMSAAGRRCVGLASDQPGFGVDDGRVGRPFASRPSRPKPEMDSITSLGLTVVRAGQPAPSVQHARLEVLHHHVAGGGEVEQPGHVAGLVQVEHDRALARVDV